MSVITQDGWSALMYAASWDRTEVVVELVKAGANLNLQSTVCQYVGDTYIKYNVHVLLYIHVYTKPQNNGNSVHVYTWSIKVR